MPDPTATAWRPIESAPRDGTWFMICKADEGHESVEVGCYAPVMYDDYEPAGEGLFRRVSKSVYDWHGFNNFHRATHWQPLPPPPGEERDGGD